MQVAMLKNDEAGVYCGFDDGVGPPTDRNIGIDNDTPVAHLANPAGDIGDQAIGFGRLPLVGEFAGALGMCSVAQ